MDKQITSNSKAMVELKRMYLLKHLDIDDYYVDVLGIYNEYIVTSDDMKVYEAQAFFENMSALDAGEEIYKWVCIAARSKWNPKEHRFFRLYPFGNDGIGSMIAVDFGEKEINQLIQFIINADDDKIEGIFTCHVSGDERFAKEMLGEGDERLSA